MSEIDHFIKDEYGADITNLSYSERWRLYQRIKWDLKSMDLDKDVYKQAEKDIFDFLQLNPSCNPLSDPTS